MNRSLLDVEIINIGRYGYENRKNVYLKLSEYEQQYEVDVQGPSNTLELLKRPQLASTAHCEKVDLNVTLRCN
jgi:hypothetical protein